PAHRLLSSDGSAGKARASWCRHRKRCLRDRRDHSQRIGCSVPTEARAKPALPGVGTASGASVTAVAIARPIAAGVARAVQAAVMGELGERTGVFPALAFSGVVSVVLG